MMDRTPSPNDPAPMHLLDDGDRDQSPGLGAPDRGLRRLALVILAAALALSLVALTLAQDLSLESDLERLLPPQAPSVVGLEKLGEAYGAVGRLSVVLDGPSPEALEPAVASVAALLEARPEVEGVETTRPVEFFEKVRLLYLEREDLEELIGRIDRRVRWELERANPMFIALDEEDAEPPAVETDDLEKKYGARFDTDRYFRSKDGRRYVLFADLAFSTSEMDRSGRFLESAREQIEATLAREHPGVSLGLTGRYQKRYEQQRFMSRDLGWATLVALAGILLFLLAYFRSLTYPLVVLLPLVLGTLWAFGWAALAFGSLNILTGFLGAVLLGLGIDYGIHLVSRYDELRGQGLAPRAAVTGSMRSAGKASLFAGVTTLLALGSLALSSFRAFHEFGVLALGGLALIGLAYATVLPSLLILLGHSRLDPHRRRSPSTSTGRPDTDATPGWGRRRLTVVGLGLLGALGIAAVAGAPQVAFDYDLEAMNPTDLPAFALDREIDALLNAWQVPSIVLAEDAGHAQEIAAELRRRKEVHEDGAMIDDVITLAGLLPEEQGEKLDDLRGLRHTLEKLPRKMREDPTHELGALFAEVEALLQRGALEPGDLPEALRSRFVRRDDPAKAVVLITPAIRFSDVRETLRYTSLTSELPDASGQPTLDAISEEHLFQDILRHVREDMRVILALVVLGLLALAFLAFRGRWRPATLVLGSLLLSCALALGLTGLLGLRFNFINLLILPIWLGLGVDAGFHLVLRIDQGDGSWRGFWHTAGAVAAAFGTSMVGFGAMALSDHPGLASLGYMAVVGLATIVVVTITALALITRPGRGDLGATPTA